MNPPFDPLWLAICSIAGGVLVLGYLVFVYLRTRSRKPVIPSNDILYQERFASGRSLKSLWTRMGSANGCLRLVVTRDLLWVTTWFPFTVIAPIWDLEQVIPRNRISSIEADRGYWRKNVVIVYDDHEGTSRSIELRPRNLEAFLRALGAAQSYECRG